MVYVLVVLVLDYKVLLVCVFIVSGASITWWWWRMASFGPDGHDVVGQVC